MMMNPYTLYSEGLAEKIDKVYISTASKAPGAFGAIYNAGELYRRLPFRSPVYHVNQGMISAMESCLAEHPYDIVIMPHLFPAEIMTNVKRRSRKRDKRNRLKGSYGEGPEIRLPRTMFIATDYCCIPFTEETDCDAYVIPSADLKEDFSGRGIPEERLYPYGIPVDSGFGAERRQGAEAAEDRKYILVSGGSMGAGRIEKLLGMLLEHREQEEQRKNTGIIAVCGSNQDLYRRLKRKYGRQVIVVGHTDHMADYLRAGSLYITKPGGLSSTEAAVCGIPLLHMPPIPGCETHNARYFKEHHMSSTCDVTEEGAEAVFQLLARQELCREMVESQHRYIRKDAAVRICDLAEQMVRESAEQPAPALCFPMGAGA